jgi:magnesium transporter
MRTRQTPATPGHLITAQQDTPRIAVIDYDETHFEEREIGNLDDLAAYRDRRTVTWVNVVNPDAAALSRIGEIFNLHSLTIEDIQNRAQRPKTEDMVDYVYIAATMFPAETPGRSVKAVGQQVSLVVGKYYVLSFDEGRGQVFEPVREKLRKYKGRIRRMGSDYLLYRLLDAVVDTYFLLLERLGEKLESLEERVVTDPTPEVMREIHALRIDMTVFYRSVWPLREVVGALTRDDLPVIRKATGAYFRDVYDHTVQIIETMETDRDMVSGMLDIYVSSVSNKMNEIMKVLTVIATIFIPMTFLAGVWGMNFKHMPELDWHWAYPAFWGLMVLVAIFMLIYFRRRKWL